MENLKFLFLFFALALLLAACGQTQTTDSVDLADSSDSADAQQEQQTGSSDENQQAGAEASGSSGGSSAAENALMDMFNDKASTYMVEYEYKTGNEQLSEFSLYLKGDKMRYDTSAQGQDASVYMTEDAVYTCSGEPVACIEFAQSEQMDETMAEQMEADIKSNAESYSIISRPSRTIAGVKAECFGISMPEAESEICYSDEGVLLYTRSSANNQEVVMEAKEYSTTVSESAFELPAEPQSMEDLMAQQQ